MTDLKPIAQELAAVLQHIRRVIDDGNGTRVYFGDTTKVRIDAILDQYNDYLKGE